MIINPKSLQEFMDTNEYTELEQHRTELLKFYASEAFKAQAGFLQVAKVQAMHAALSTGKTPEAREEARLMYNLFHQILQNDDFIFSIFRPEPKEEGKKD